jgi:hypothetical protein
MILNTSRDTGYISQIYIIEASFDASHNQSAGALKQCEIALLSQEGSVIAFFAMTRGEVPHRNTSECILKNHSSGTTPRTISTAVSIVLPPDSGGPFG